MKLTKKKAIELSIKKWEWIVENDGDETFLLDIFPELAKMKGECALCELYRDTSSERFTCCFECPIRPKYQKYSERHEVGCNQESHPYMKWFFNGTKETAQAVLDLIKSCKC